MATFQLDLNILPSMGKYYDVNYIEYTGLDVKDVFDIATSSNRYLDEVLYSIIEKKNIIKNMDYRKILLIDKDIIFLKIREATFTSTMFEVNFKCDNCKLENNNEIDIFNHIMIEQIDEDFRLPDFSYANDSASFKMKFPTIGDINLTKKLSSNEIISSFYNETIASLVCMIKKDPVVTYEILNGKAFDDVNFIPADIKRLFKYITTHYNYGVEDTITVKCSHCDHDVRVPFRINNESFI